MDVVCVERLLHVCPACSSNDKNVLKMIMSGMMPIMVKRIAQSRPMASIAGKHNMTTVMHSGAEEKNSNHCNPDSPALRLGSATKLSTTHSNNHNNRRQDKEPLIALATKSKHEPA